jgi:hypothetical protein
VPPRRCEIRLGLLSLLARRREEDVVDGYVDLVDAQSYQVLDPPYDIASHRFGDLRYGPAVLYSHREIEGGLLLANLRRDAAGSARRAASHTVEDSADGAGGATAHLHPLYVLSRDAGDLGDDSVAYGGVAALGLQRRPFLLLGLPAASPSFGHGVLLLPTRLHNGPTVSTVGMMTPAGVWHFLKGDEG